MSQSAATDRWLYGVLSSDGALLALVGTRVYADLAPDGTQLPVVIYQMQSARDRMMVGSTRIWSDQLYLVRGIAETPAYGGDLLTIADRIDVVLHAASGSTVEGTVFECVREREFRMVETINGRQYRHLGGVYRILTR